MGTRKADQNSALELSSSTKKRRRVPRACDECRARKTKCTGGRPCALCSNNERGCSYEQSRSPRLSTAAYVRELETKIHRLTELLGQSTPEEGNTCDPTGRHHSSRSTLSSDGEAVNHEEAMAVVYVETMMDGVGHLRQEQDGAYIYHGHYAGLTLLERVYACCRQQMPKATEDVTFSIARIFDGPLPACSEFRSVSRGAQGTLPERATAEELISVALNNACFLLPFVHGPTLARELDRIYSVESNHYCETDSTSQALFYAILAVGALFSSMNRGVCNDNSSLHFHYFQTAIGMIDPAYCRDLVILQAIIFVIMYLQGTGRLSHCYSYLALASGSAFQMGIHRNYTPPHLDLVQVEIRKRVYWSLYTIDIYTSTVLGLPRTIADYPSDQEELSEIVAWGATSGRCHLEAPTASSVLTLANHHIKILNIMAKVVDFLCSTKMQPAGCNRYCQVEAARLSQIESDLEEWYTTLPPVSNKSDPTGFDPISAHLRLRLAYAHVQMVLYRPFLHHIIGTKARSEAEMHSYTCASACIKAAMQVIWIVRQLHQRGHCVAPCWPSLFMTLFSALTLVMFALGNQGGATVEEAWHAVKSALWLFSQLASNNNALAQKCAVILEEFIEGQSPCSVDSTYDECQVSQPVCNSTAESAVAPSEWGDSRSCDCWPGSLSWTTALSNINAPYFSPSAD